MDSDVKVARFPGQTCSVCGQEFVPRETEIIKNPNMMGPRGGARWMHHNPSECSGARANAGRRSYKGAPKSGRLPPRGPRTYDAPVAFETAAKAHHADLAFATSQMLAQLASGDDAELKSLAARELQHRDRSASGRKTAWGEGPSLNEMKAKAASRKKAANNPFDLF